MGDLDATSKSPATLDSEPDDRRQKIWHERSGS
jgi:hypothetical protein